MVKLAVQLSVTSECYDFFLGSTTPAGLQGFQCFVDDHSGFGQMAADVVAELKVDYPNAPVMLYPVRPTQQAPPHATVSIWRLHP